MKWNTSSRDIAGISSCRPPVFPPFLLLHLSNMRFSCGARVFEPGVFLRFSGQTFFWGCTSPIPDWYRYEHNDWQWSSFSFRWVNHTPQQHHIYIYISKPLEQQILLCWCRCQDERLRVPSKHAQWHRSCVRGDSRRRNSAAEIAGRKRSEPIGGWKIEGTPIWRDISRSICENIWNEDLWEPTVRPRWSWPGWFFEVRTDTQR